MSTDLWGRYKTFHDTAVKKNALGGVFSVVGSLLGPYIMVMVDGKAVRLMSCVSLDYLGVGDDDDITTQCAKFAKELGTGAATSRTVMDSIHHQKLESTIADWKRGEACLLVNTGYTANVIGPNLVFKDIIVTGGHRYRQEHNIVVHMDAQSHASLQSTFSALKNTGDIRDVKKYPHARYDLLEEALRAGQSEYARQFMVADGVFSMGGDSADMPTFLRLAKQFNAPVFIDEAHSAGVYGDQGRGILEHQGIVSADDLQYFIQTMTLSKAVCGLGGGLILPSADLVHLARYSQWEYIFSVAIPTFLAATYTHTIEVIRGDIGNAKRLHLYEISALLRKMLRDDGFNIFNTDTHIIPINIGDTTLCLTVQDYLIRVHHIWLGAIRFPAVAKNGALLRCALTAGHSVEDVHKIVVALKQARDKFRF